MITEVVLAASGAPLSAQVTRLESAVTVAGGGNERSSSPAVSDDGRFVTFESSASNLVAGDTNAQQDVFVSDHSSGATVRISIASDGAQANGLSYQPAI